MSAFFERLAARIDTADSVVSVGLDPDPERIPEFIDADLPRWAFNRRVIDATHEHAACYKPNAAFYEDANGWRALRETVAYAHGKDVPVLLDAKRGDIGNTARQYAASVEALGADAVTVNPYLGRDSLQPFLSKEELGVFALCRTSNAGGADLQDLTLEEHDRTLYEHVARLAETRWNEHDNLGLVVGATGPDELEALRELVDLPFLVPGVGAQGGDAQAAVEHGLATRGEDESGEGAGVGLVNSSRGIIFAGEGARDEGAYFRAVRDAARSLQERLNEYR